MVSLDSFFEQKDVVSIKAKIRQRRAQMLVHSCIYYDMNHNIISDHKWQEWADELEVLQRENPECCKIDFFDFEFHDWTGATGNHLPLQDPWVAGKAKWLVEYDNEYRKSNGQNQESSGV
jgi:hypothetical protein